MGSVLEELTAIRTVAEMTEAFRDEARCCRLVEAMVWPNGGHRDICSADNAKVERTGNLAFRRHGGPVAC